MVRSLIGHFPCAFHSDDSSWQVSDEKPLQRHEHFDQSDFLNLWIATNWLLNCFETGSCAFITVCSATHLIIELCVFISIERSYFVVPLRQFTTAAGVCYYYTAQACRQRGAIPPDFRFCPPPPDLFLAPHGIILGGRSCCYWAEKNDKICDFGQKKPSDFGEDPFFLRSPVISARKIRRKPLPPWF